MNFHVAIVDFLAIIRLLSFAESELLLIRKPFLLVSLRHVGQRTGHISDNRVVLFSILIGMRSRLLLLGWPPSNLHRNDTIVREVMSLHLVPQLIVLKLYRV
jgi:hypothetical protein